MWCKLTVVEERLSVSVEMVRRKVSKIGGGSVI